MCDLGKVIRKIRVPKSKPLVGYRAWEKGLRPLVMDGHPWKRHGKNRSDKRPRKINDSGLHAFKSKAWFKILMGHSVRETSHDQPITGKVEMWGTVIVHSFGYRASRARIKKIIAGKENTSQPQ